MTSELPTAPVQEKPAGGVINPFSLFSTFISIKDTQKSSEIPTSPTTTAVVEKLDRTDSHDSLQSYVNIKSTDTAPPPTWGNYLSSFVWKQSTIEQAKKQD